MTLQPKVQPLPYKQRRSIFLVTLLVFIVAVPLLVFYAMGYRFNFTNDTDTSITSVGGMYITSGIRDIDIFVDEQPVTDMRIFQQAAYIQNLKAGMHTVHTQGPGLQTWTKALPIFSHFVTEAQSFNIPKVPQIRIISEYKTLADQPVFFQNEVPLDILSIASSTQVVVIASSTVATSTFIHNPEYTYTKALFASSSAKKLAIQEYQQRAAERFIFATSAASSTFYAEATTTKTYRDTRLFEKGGEVYIQWDGTKETIPYYYCVRYNGATTTALNYGKHVKNALQRQFESVNSAGENQAHLTQQPSASKMNTQQCRDRIRIDRKGKEVLWFDYFPGTRDLILMQLTDGLYVVEVDDRAWQNTQLLYPGSDIDALLDGRKILVHTGPYYLEVFTELQQQ